MAHQSNNPLALDSLKMIAERSTRGDRELQFTEPHRWARGAALIAEGFESKLQHEGTSAAADFAVSAYELFASADLRGPCRTALGCLARLADEHLTREPFDSIARTELGNRVDFKSITDIGAKVQLAAIELQCRAEAMDLLKGDKAAVRELTGLTHVLVREADLSWRDCGPRDLWLMHYSASRISESASLGLRELGREAWELATSTRYLADLVSALVDKGGSVNPGDESPIKILNISALGARDEYIDLVLPTRCEQLLADLKHGHAARFQERASKIADHIGRVICRLEDIREGAFAFRALLDTWRQGWFTSCRSSGRERNKLLSAQFPPVVRGCSAMSLACGFSTDSRALREIAQHTEEFLGSEDTRRSKAPASSVAPVWMVAGRLWERIYEIDNDVDAGDKALTLYLQACRLLPLTPVSPTDPLVDCLDRIKQLEDVRDLDPAEQGAIHFGYGFLATKSSDHRSALQHLIQSGVAFEEAITDPEIRGLKHMTFLTGRVYSDAADAARHLGRKDLAVMYLNKAASVLEETARIFKIQKTRQEIETMAERYRVQATQVVGSGAGESQRQPS
jgi:hypothetical protein